MNVSAAEARNAAVPEEPVPGGMAALFDLESFEADMFRSRGLPGEARRQFGGHLAAQALAAGRVFSAGGALAATVTQEALLHSG